MGRAVRRADPSFTGVVVIFHDTKLADVYLIELEPHRDERGFFARSFCAAIFKDKNLPAQFCQSSVSFNDKAGIIRGLHYQKAPYLEEKMVRCVRGEIFDVVVDLRANSPTFGQHQAFRLQEGVYQFLYIPKGCAHGFQSLKDHSEVHYHCSTAFEPESAAGILWSCQELAIQWPLDISIISKRDQDWPSFSVFKENV